MFHEWKKANRSMELEEAVALITEDEPRARAALQSMAAAAQARGDAEAVWHAAVAMLLAINVEFVDFRGRVEWCRRFAAVPPGLSFEAFWPPARAGDLPALRACAAYLCWPLLDSDAPLDADTTHGCRDALAEGLRVSQALPPGERFVLAKTLLDHFGQEMNTLGASRVIALQHDHFRAQPVNPVAMAQWWLVLMNHHEYFGDADAAQQARQRLQALIDAHGLLDARFVLLTLDMPVVLKAGQLARADRIHRELEALMPERRAGFLPHALRAQACCLAQRGDFSAALALVDRLLAVCADLEVPERDQGAYHNLRANILTNLGRFDEARAELRSLRQHQPGTQGEVLTVIESFTEAAARLDTQPEAALEFLADALAGAVRLQFNRFFFTFPQLAARLCQTALDAGLEPEFVRATIRDRHLVPPDPTRADWPWRLRIHVLGELSVTRDEQPLRWAGKAQRKPLELLGLLAAHGGGPVDADALIDALWPSLEADAPKASLEMAVSRLRKLLDVPDAVQVADGAVSLDPALAWCDAAAFETLAERLQTDLAERPADPALARSAERLFALYRDRLLGSEELAGPMLVARERLALSFYRAVSRWGAALEARSQWGAAIALYERALTREVLAEPIYRALMRAHLACGERAEALRTFRRCRELLAAVLGTTPAAETLALFHEASVPASP
jgi:DNA-binding SARP family transcriptional activator